MFEYLNKWIYYPWLPGNNLDYLISSDDLPNIDGLGVVLCVGEEDDFIKVKNDKGVYRVLKKGINRILPTPKFLWKDSIILKDNPAVSGFVSNFFWHHNKEQYIYYLEIGGKKKARQFLESELCLSK